MDGDLNITDSELRAVGVDYYGDVSTQNLTTVEIDYMLALMQSALTDVRWVC